VHFINASNAHLQEAEQEQKPQQPSRMARADGATAKVDERLDHIEASLRELHTAHAEDHAILEQLRDHMMGSLDVRDYDIHSSSKGRGSLSARDTPRQGLVDCSLRR
jgi:hypothetical protein